MSERTGGRDFVTGGSSQGSDTLVHRMVLGLGSNKYRAVDYGRLRALASEKRFKSLKTAMKVSKLQQQLAANKESSLNTQHQLLWHKELLRLHHLRKKLQTEAESHLRHNAGTEACGHIYSDFEYQDSALTSAFDLFRKETTQPIWNLRDDLKYWLLENREDLKLGYPDTIAKHFEIRETVNSVKSQQARVLEQLGHEQQCLEMDLDTEELRELCPTWLEKRAHVTPGIPSEFFQLPCPHPPLKGSLMQEFLILDDKYSARIQGLNDRHALALKLGERGGWESEDHFSFVAVHDQYPCELTNRRTLLFNRLKRHLPHKTRSELSDHEDWWMDYKYLKERIKGAYSDWARDRRELFTKVKLTLQEATVTQQLEELHSENVQRQKQLCEALYDKVRAWREQKFLALQMEAELEAQQQQRVQEMMAAEAQEEQRRRHKDKLKIREFQAERQQQQRKQEEDMQKRLKMLREDLAQQAMVDQERVKFRQEQLEERLEERRKEEERREVEEEEKERRLESIREQVRVVAESDPLRTMQDTKAWQAHHTEDEDHSIQKPLFSVNSFTAKQIVSDPRVRLENKLREAGLQNSDYARSVLSQMKPRHAPRKDTVSTLRLDNP